MMRMCLFMELSPSCFASGGSDALGAQSQQFDGVGDLRDEVKRCDTSRVESWSIPGDVGDERRSLAGF